MPKPGADEATTREGYTRVLKAFKRWLGRYTLRPQTIERHVSNVQRFAEAYLERQQPPLAFHEVTPTDMHNYLIKALPPDIWAKDTVPSFKKFFKFMGETGRMDYGTACDILDDLRIW